MKTFLQWLESSRNHNLSGVPWFAPGETRPIRGPIGGGDHVTERMRSESMTNRYKYAIGRRFVARKGGYMESKFFPGATGLITAIKGDNLSYKMDHETKKRVAPTRSFLQNNVDLLDEEQEEGQESVTDN